ncbi:hypothetical protein JTB14_026726 [Gonioctena quinquepunctata]|nr:hypothetical protein JTB14_026726 [Gonioctena quinquepunctata]
MHKAEIAIEIVENWMEENGVTLAKHKTETVVLKGPRNKDNIVSRAGETSSLQPVKHLKYLGITLSENGDYREHIRRAAKKTTLSRIMPNISGPSSQKRSMLHGVVKYVLLYGAQLWHPILEKAKKEERTRTLDAWQEEWEVAECTRMLIPELGKCEHRRTYYYLTQVFTGHGAFRTYLKRFKRAETEECKYCSAIDTVAHTLFDCPGWHTQRQTLHVTIGTADLTTENFLEVMIMEREKWKSIHNSIRTVMKTKEQEE